MELNPETIHTVIHPTAVLKRTTVPPSQPTSKALSPLPADIAWDLSQLNPKNRIDSLAPLATPNWRIDGCTSWGSQYYATPLFMASVPPMRIDVFVPDLSLQTRLVRDVLELDQAFHMKDRVRVSRLAVSMHILRRLQNWTMTIGGADQEFTNDDGPTRRRTHSERLEYAEKYLCHLPFGSRIVFDSLSLDIKQIDITVVPTFALEVYHFSVRQFEAAWGHDVTLPPCVHITQVQLVEQIHDSTSIVRIDGQSYIFKALTSFPKYLYHELRILLTTEPHPNIMSRPVHLVTKRTRFGGKNAVLGFTLELHRHGTLRDIVPFLSSSNALTIEEQFKWAYQITSAVFHFRETSGTFYPDLRLDNIVLSESRDAIMVDFEQRGVWCEFASPEVNAIEYMRILATAENPPFDVTSAQQPYRDIMERICPEYETLTRNEKYDNYTSSYNVSWESLTPREQEASEVYMLGRVLWCLFEGVSAPQKATIWVSYRWESHLQFPEYQRTPPRLRQLIDECTKGRRETLDNQVLRVGNKLVLRADLEANVDTNPDVLSKVAREWWEKEVGWAEKYLADREAKKQNGTWDDNPYDRPSIRQVLQSLDSIRAEIMV
ncbi:uncharacterized protein VDAG_03167 [Verticillium dahliae VdLs.17]|uniref:Protein kinase domain-containing protein n=1 Tax=Verticillium dahliae (strain VdLs.17 / ATCC MYA-4575 / FGSC 10137) TaxID=498257 RepID=G2WYS5_VERDV|nr:uncharacterized protein VDAG_03167 [Verticillium dahliae VdLs.17]EGY21727.1 hypothetical protein VDAG_03167 [Verticillium dahliae VdLs.17]